LPASLALEAEHASGGDGLEILPEISSEMSMHASGGDGLEILPEISPEMSMHASGGDGLGLRLNRAVTGGSLGGGDPRRRCEASGEV
jgi:hypothetical protein